MENKPEMMKGDSVINLLKKILEKGHNAATEQVIVDRIEGIKKIVDVVDITSRVMYEVEKEPDVNYIAKADKLANQFGGVSMVVDLRKIPKDIKEKIKELAKLIEGIVI
jgi:hypothetical protein